MPGRYNLRSSKSKPVETVILTESIESIESVESYDGTINIEVHPSWSYGVYSLTCNNQLITIPSEPNAQIFKFEFDKSTPLNIVKNTIFNTIPLKGTGGIQTNLKNNYVTEKYKMPQTYSNLGKELNKNEYPCNNFNDIFNSDNSLPVSSLLKTNTTKLILYSHLSGTYTISNVCSIC